MESELSVIAQSCAYIQSHCDLKPEIAIVLGSGLGSLGADFSGAVFPYQEIPNMPAANAPGHCGKLIFTKICGKNAVIMQGRVHFYEGHTMQEVVRPVRIMRALGADKLILTNAAGAVNETFSPGDLAVITDHILSFVPSPLIGNNLDAFGTRFPDMSEVYSIRLQRAVHQCASQMGIFLRSGVYLQTTGPNYETPAEIRMFQRLGADMVGMSTACEAVAAKHAGMEILGLSVISNMAAGLSETALNHSEVQESTAAVSDKLKNLICNLVEMI